MVSEKQKIERVIKQAQAAILQGKRISSRIKKAVSSHPTAHVMENWSSDLADLVGDLEKIKSLAQDLLLLTEKKE